jgi:subtilase family serine protease
LFQRGIALALFVSLAACGGGGGSHALPAASGGNVAGGGSQSTSSTATTISLKPNSRLRSSAVATGLATNVPSLVMHVMVTPKNAAGLADYAKGASTKGDARYRHWLTASQIGDLYGASTADQTTVANYFASFGLKVGSYPQRLGLTIAGARQKFEAALGTKMSLFKTTDGHTLIAPTGNITFTKPLPIVGIADAAFDGKAKHRQFVGGPGTGTSGGETPLQIATAFDYTSAYKAGYTGAGITIGIIATGPFQHADFASFKAQYGIPGGTGDAVLEPVTSSAAYGTYAAGYGGSPTAVPPPVTAPCSQSDSPYADASESPTATCNPEDIEAQIDTEQASLAPDAAIKFILAYVPGECYDPTTNSCGADPNTGLGYNYQGLDESDDELQQAIADNNGGAGGPDVLSLSYGGPEVLESYYVSSDNGATYDPTSFEPTEFAALAAEGVAVFVSSGDQGAQTCAPYSMSLENDNCISYPSDDVSVTSVGGVTAALQGNGALNGPITSWGAQTATGGASGGGVSTIIPAPPWQVAPTYTGASGFGTVSTFRNQPDVSLEGDPTTGVAVRYDVGLDASTTATYGGTSVAAPETAAMWALVLQACKASTACNQGGTTGYRLGNAAPYFWALYTGSNASYISTMYDVTFGSNGLVGCEVYDPGTCTGNETPAPGYQAGAGYDHVTGLGVPFGGHTVNAIISNVTSPSGS